MAAISFAMGLLTFNDYHRVSSRHIYIHMHWHNGKMMGSAANTNTHRVSDRSDCQAKTTSDTILPTIYIYEILMTMILSIGVWWNEPNVRFAIHTHLCIKHKNVSSACFFSLTIRNSLLLRARLYSFHFITNVWLGTPIIICTHSKRTRTHREKHWGRTACAYEMCVRWSS